MINTELIDFIKKQKAVGKTNEEIKSVLLANGWNNLDLEEGFKQINPVIPNYPNISVNPASPVVETPFHIPTIINPQPINQQPTPLTNFPPRIQPIPIINPVINSGPVSTTQAKLIKKSRWYLVSTIIVFILLAGILSVYFFLKSK